MIIPFCPPQNDICNYLHPYLPICCLIHTSRVRYIHQYPFRMGNSYNAFTPPYHHERRRGLRWTLTAVQPNIFCSPNANIAGALILIANFKNSSLTPNSRLFWTSPVYSFIRNLRVHISSTTKLISHYPQGSSTKYVHLLFNISDFFPHTTITTDVIHLKQ